MNTLLKLILIPVCFLYAITPGKSGWEHTEAFYKEAFVLGIMNAFLLSGVFYYFFGEPQDTYLGTVYSVGFWLGAWTFIGGIYYPAIAQTIEKETEAADKKASDEAFRKYNQEGFEKIWSEDAYFDLLTKNRQACFDLTLEAARLHRTGKGQQAEMACMRDFSFVSDEMDRFGINFENVV